jgi:transcriptional regulator with XRE-family HTH domain
MESNKIKLLVRKIQFLTEWSQQEIASRIGCKRTYLSGMVSGATAPTEQIESKLTLLLEEVKATKSQVVAPAGDEGNVPVYDIGISDGLPYYESENFECGTPAGFGGALEVASPDGYFQFPWVKNDGSTFCVRAHGNSMLNHADPIHSIAHGAYIALRKSNMGAIQWGEVYALATADGYVIKKIMPSEREGCVRCVSFNDSEFPSFDLPTADIYDYAIVVGVANISVW